MDLKTEDKELEIVLVGELSKQESNILKICSES